MGQHHVILSQDHTVFMVQDTILLSQEHIRHTVFDINKYHTLYCK